MFHNCLCNFLYINVLGKASPFALSRAYINMFYPIAKYDIPIIILIIFYFIFSGTVTVMNVFPFDKHYGFTYTDVLILKRALFRPCIKLNLIVYIL